MKIISNCNQQVLQDSAKSLKVGNLVAFPTETVYGLGADASNLDAVSRIYEVKGRPKNHPLIVHISSINTLDKWAINIPDYAVNLAKKFWPGPLTLILQRQNLAKDFLTGGQDFVGIRVPNHKIAIKLIREFEILGGLGVAAPSANRFSKVSPTSAKDVMDDLNDYLSENDLILDGGVCEIGVESTIVDCSSKFPKILRPGAITKKMIEEIGGSEVGATVKNSSIKTSGLMGNHYSPKSKVYISGKPSKGDGFIALASIGTPQGAIRLASPLNNIQYAQQLYKALRLSDKLGIEKVFVVPAIGDDLSIAINDRLEKAKEK
jgi:L-threonylcarbamoyladenylate synthase